MAAPRVKPLWFLPLTRYKYGLGPRPTAPKIMKGGQYQWVLDEWAKFDRWHAWRDHGGPRPKGIWTSVPDWAWRIRRELNAKQHAVVVAPDKPFAFRPVPSKTAGRCGLYFYSFVNKPMSDDRLIELCRQHDLWVALLTHELGRAPNPSFDTQSQRARLQSAGITVVSSGWVEAGFDLKAQTDAAAHFSQGFDEYLMNAEASWAYPAPGFSQMGAFAPMLRKALGPTMPLSVSCLWGQQTWWRPLLEAGLSVVRPQTYMNEWPHQDPAEAVVRCGWDQSDLKGGVPAKMVEPTLGTYGDHKMSMSSYAGRVAQALERGARACSVWAAADVPEADYPRLASFRR